MRKYHYVGLFFKLWKSSRVLLLDFEVGGEGVLKSNLWILGRSRGPGVLAPLLHHAVSTDNNLFVPTKIKFLMMKKLITNIV